MKKLSIPMVVAAMDMVYGDEAKEDGVSVMGERVF